MIVFFSSYRIPFEFSIVNFYVFLFDFSFSFDVFSLSILFQVFFYLFLLTLISEKTLTKVSSRFFCKSQELS